MSADTGATYVLHPKPEQVTLTLPAPLLAENRTTYDHMNGLDGGVWPAETCGMGGPPDDRFGPGCGKPISENQPVCKMRGWWLHADCARNAVTVADVDEAWLLIADQVAARPHKFRASEIRTVLNSVAAIASRAASRGGGTA